MHEIVEALLDGEAPDGGDDGAAAEFELLEVAVGIFVEMVVGGLVVLVEGVVDDVDFVQGDMVLVVDDALGGLGDGDDFVGQHQAFVLDLVDEGVAGLHTGAVKFGGVDVGDEGEAVIFLGKDASLEGKPVVGVDHLGLELHEVSVDELTVGLLDVANGDVLGFVRGGDDFF